MSSKVLTELLLLFSVGGRLDNMKFSALLTKLIPKDFGARSDLARKLDVTVNYITDVAAGRRKAPTFTRCRQIAEALKLSKEESDQLIQAAARERLPQKELEAIYEAIAAEAMKDNLAKHHQWSAIKGTATCPHCDKEVEIEVNQKGEVSIYGRVQGKVKRN